MNHKYDSEFHGIEEMAHGMHEMVSSLVVHQDPRLRPRIEDRRTSRHRETAV